MLQERFIELANEIDRTEDLLNDALEEDRFDDAARLSPELERKVEELTRIYVQMCESADIADLQPYTEYLEQLQDAQTEQIELLNEERERVRKELINFNKGSQGKNSYNTVEGYKRNKTLSERLGLNKRY